MKIKIVFLLCLVCVLSGCSRMGSCEKGNLNMEKAMEDITTKIVQEEWTIGMLQDEVLSAEELFDQYLIEASEFDEVIVKQALIPASCGELAIFHLNDEDYSKVEVAIQARMNALKQELILFPQQTLLLNQYQTARNHDYVIFVIGEDAEKVIAYFNSL